MCRRFVLLAAALSFGTVQAAIAADMPIKAPSYVQTAPVFSWTGCYVGANVGGGWSTSGWNESDYYGNGVGAVAGGQAGCNYQINRLVVGAEGEFDWSGITNNTSYSEPETGPDYAGSYASSTRTRNLWDATLAVRAGFLPLDNLLIYGKLGVAWGAYNLSYTCCNYAGVDAPFNGTESAQTTATGIVVGAGFEYAIANNWTAKFEYEYIDYGSPSFNVTAVSSAGVLSTYTETYGQNKQIVKVGLNYKFDWGPGAIAK
jgi:outer membrane immunogenic protein